MKTEKKQVSIVIPNFNGIKFIANCLKSLDRQTFQDFETIVVDNGSTDGSLEVVAEQFESVRLVKLDKNYGFCMAVNEGIKASDAEYVILLNNDTVAQAGFIEELVKAVESSGQIFSCSSKMLQLYDKELIDDTGDYYCALGWAYTRGKGKSAELFDADAKIFAACGGASIYRREVFEKIGYFDEAHFAYLEDIDIGYRAKIHGYQNTYASKAIVYHAGSASSGSRYNEFKVKLASRNSIYLVYKNMPWIQIVLNLPFLLAGFLIKTIFFARKGFGKTYVNGLLEGMKKARGLKKVPFCAANLGNYVVIQWELWVNVLRRLVS
ncbi:glycosyltransferase family 2 protein [Konateibacter massiliensis]|uniref:glycosyltransferase family 2 protein n=1 Tax=Konateibacter massiliensis TaxID=2002841 RepID=UPI000C1508E9|nr:glycosyltransferase family 2 protein [Konateibacter massiliensis]